MGASRPRGARGSRPGRAVRPVEFPQIGNEPWFISLGPHSFLWLQLRDDRAAASGVGGPAVRPTLERPATLAELTATRRSGELVRALRTWLPDQRWFRGRTRTIRGLAIVDTVPIPAPGRDIALAIVEVSYTEGDPERYLPVLALADGGLSEDESTRIADLTRDGAPAGHLIDAAADPAVGRWLVSLIGARGRGEGPGRGARGSRHEVVRVDGAEDRDAPRPPHPRRAEQQLAHPRRHGDPQAVSGSSRAARTRTSRWGGG